VMQPEGGSNQEKRCDIARGLDRTVRLSPEVLSQSTIRHRISSVRFRTSLNRDSDQFFEQVVPYRFPTTLCFCPSCKKQTAHELKQSACGTRRGIRQCVLCNERFLREELDRD
jgi:hypothetical protein